MIQQALFSCRCQQKKEKQFRVSGMSLYVNHFRDTWNFLMRLYYYLKKIIFHLRSSTLPGVGPWKKMSIWYWATKLPFDTCCPSWARCYLTSQYIKVYVHSINPLYIVRAIYVYYQSWIALHVTTQATWRSCSNPCFLFMFIILAVLKRLLIDSLSVPYNWLT